MMKIFTLKSVTRKIQYFTLLLVIFSAFGMNAGAATGTSLDPHFTTTAAKDTYMASLLAPAIDNFSPKSGKPGSKITVTGRNFAGLTSFKIGNDEVAILLNSGTKIVGQIFPKTKTGAITLSNVNGSVKSKTSFTIPVGSGYTTNNTQYGDGNYTMGQLGSISMSTDGTAAVSGESGTPNTQAVVFGKINGNWQITARLSLPNYGSTGAGNSGISISGDGLTIGMGVSNSPSTNQGAVAIYTRPNSTSAVWTQQASVVPTPGNKSWANCLQLSSDGNTMIVGSLGGYIGFFYRTPGTATWTQTQILNIGGYTGYNVAISGDGLTAMFDELYGNTDAFRTSKVYVYSGGSWVFQANLITSTVQNPGQIGQGVALSYNGNTAVYGCPYANAVDVFTRTAGTSTWSSGTALVASDIGTLSTSTYYGQNVAVSGDGSTILVGAPGTSAGGDATFFINTTGSWTQLGPSKIYNYNMGSGVALNTDGYTAAIGASADMGGGTTGGLQAYGSMKFYAAQTPPTVQATNLIFSAHTTTSVTASWTNGGGAQRAVFILNYPSGTPVPVNSTTYTASTTFASGTQIGTTGWYCVYNGSGSSVNITGLSANSVYQVMVDEYNGAAGSELYLSSTATGDPSSFSANTSAIATTGALSANNSTFGTPSAVSTFSVSGTAMSAAIIATAPTGYEVSLTSTSGFGSTATVPFVNGGTIPSTPIYVRLTALAGVAAGPFSGNVVLSSSGSNSATVPTVSSSVTPVALTVTATNASKNYGVVLAGASGSTAFTSTGLQNADAISSVTIAYGTGSAGTVAVGTSTGGVTASNPVATSGTFLASNYTIGFTAGNILTTPAPITVTATGPLKGYGTVLASVTGGSNFTPVTGANSEAVTSVTMTPNTAGTAANTAVGAAYVVTPSAATGPSFTPSNYTITYVPYNGTVTVGAITVSVLGQTKVYGTALASGTTTNAAYFSTTGTLSTGESVTGLTLTPNANGLNATAAMPSTYSVAGSLATGTGGFLASNYIITYSPYNGTETGYPITVTATGPSKSYGTVLTAAAYTTNFTPSASVGSETMTGLTLTPDVNGQSATVAAGSAFVVVPSAATGTSGFLASNYVINYVQFNGTVTTAPLTISATGPLKPYGTVLGTTTGTTGFAPVTGMNSQAVSGITLTPNAAGIAASTAVGQGYLVTPSAATGTNGFLASNYTINYLPYNGTVTGNPITVTVTGPAKTYGTALTTGATTNTGYFSVSGTLSTGESVTGLTLTPNTPGLSATSPVTTAYSVAGSLATGSGGFLASNYTITYTPYSGTVTQVPLTITAIGPVKPYGTALTAGAITNTSLFTAVGTITGETVTGLTLTPDVNGQTGTTGVGSAYAVTPSAATGTGNFLASNYLITYTAYHGTVTSQPLVINALGQTKAYGIALAAGTTTNTALFSVTGAAPNETVTGLTLTPNTAGIATSTAAGASYIVVPSAATGTGGFNTANYTITYNQYNGTVGQVPLTIVATGPSKTYGTSLATGAFPAADFTATGMNSGETVTGVTLTPNAAGISSNTASGASYSLTPSAATGAGGFLAANYAISYIPFTGATGPATLTLTATGPLKAYGTALTATTGPGNFTASATVNSETVTSMTLSPNAAGQSTTTTKGSSYVITPTAATGGGGFLASNYTITYVPYTGIVAGNILTITATGPGRIYGTALAATTGTGNFSVSGLINGDQVTGMTLTPNSSGMNASLAAGSSYTVTPSAPTGNSTFAASNYILNFVSYTGTISPLAITVTATGPSKAYHTALSAVASTTSFTATGLAAGDQVTGVTLSPDATGQSSASPVGAVYVVTPSAATGNANFAAANYTITYVNYTGAVSPNVLTITATGPAKTYGSVLSAQTTTNTALFTASGMVSGETVTGLTLTPNAAGTSASTAVGANFVISPTAATGTGGFLSSNYTVNYIPFTGTVTAAPLTITATGPLKKYGVALVAGTSTSSFNAVGLASGETVTSVTLTPDINGQSTTAANGTTYQVIPSAASGANGFIAANYTITYAPYTGTIGSSILTLTAISPNKIYGTTLTSGISSSGFTVSGTFPGETVTAATLTPDAPGLSATTAAGATYTIVPSAPTGTGGFLASNYTLNYISYTGAVSTAPLSVLATGPSKAYGTALASAASAGNFTASGMKNSDAVTSVTLSPDASGQSATTAAGSTYLVTPSAASGTNGFLIANYTISYLPYTGTVTPIALTVTATGPNKPFGTALSAAATSSSFLATGAASGETVTGITLTPDAAGFSATTASGAHYVMTPSAATGTGGFLATNYTVNYVPYTGTVNALNLLVTATGTTKTYGTALTQVATTVNFTTSGTVGSDVVTGITLTPNAAGMSATTASGLNFIMTPSLPVGNSSFVAANYNITYAGFTGTVVSAPLTVNATGPLKAYGVALAAGTSTSSFTATGAISGEAVTSVTLTPDAAGQSTGTASTAPYSVTPSAATGTGGFLASNYIITYNPYSGTVGTTALTITATALPRAYGIGLAAGPGTDFIATGTLPGQTVTSVTITPDSPGGSNSTLAGANFTLTPSAATGTGSFLASNYAITYLPYTGTVAPGALTITATGLTKSYGVALSTATAGAIHYSTLGTANGDVVNSLTLTPDAAGASATTAVGSAYVETPSAPTSTGSFNPNNYTITFIPYHGTVSAASLVVTATGPAKVFGQSLSATTGSTGFVATGMAAGEQVNNVTLTPNTAGATATTAYNASYSVIPSAATGTGGFLASNYVVTYNAFNGTVSQAPLIIIATGPTKSYGTSLAAVTGGTNFSASGMVNTDQVTGMTLTPNSAGMSPTTAAGENYIVVPGTATGNSSFAATNYAITYIPFTGSVDPQPITVTATGPVKPYGTALAASTSTTNFLATAGVNGEAITGVNLSPDANGLSASTPKGATYQVIPSAATGTGGFSPENYSINYVPFIGTVGSTILTITATGPGRIYGTPLTATTGSANFTVSGLLGSDQVTGITLTPDATGGTASSAAGSTYQVTPSAPTGNSSFIASNYTVNYIPYSGTISPLTLTIAAKGPGKVYHTALSAGSSTSNFTATGLATGDLVNSVTLTPDAAGQALTTAAGAAYLVTPSAPAGNTNFSTANYTITYLPYTGTVSTSVLTVTATGPVKSYGTILATATTGSGYTAVGMASGETVTSMTLTPNSAGTSATAVSGSTYLVTPSGATGGGGFLASNYTVNYLPYTGTVSAQPLTVTATGPLKPYGVALGTTTSTSSFNSAGLASGETITSVTLTPDAAGVSTTTATSAAYSVMPSAAAGAGGFLPSNYSITYLPYTGSVGSNNLTITATSPNKRYGTALSSGTGTAGFIASGTLPGESVTGITLTVNAAGLSTSTAAGTTYTVTPTAATGTGGFIAANYTVTYVPYSGPVLAAPLSILATGPAKPYGTQLTQATSITGFTASGAVGGDVVTGVTLSPDASGQAAATAAGATYQVVPGLATGNGSFATSNYAITYLPYTGTVSAIPLTVTATGPHKAFGTPLTGGVTSINFTATGMAAGELVTAVTLTPDAPGVSSSTPSGAHYVMTPAAATGTGGFLATNYTINYVPYTGTVNALAMTITATGTEKVYGQALVSATTTDDFTVTGAVGSDEVTGITLSPNAAGQSATTPAGNGFVMTPSLPTGNSSFIASNYIITYTGFTGTVAAAPLTVNATGPLKKYGVALAAGTSTSSFTATGAVTGETVTSVTLTPDAAGVSTTTANGAGYTVVPTAATGTGGFNVSNYTVIYNTYYGTVGTASLTITATGPAKSYGTALGTVASGTAFTTTGTFPGETVTAVTLTPNSAGASAGTVAGSSYSVVPTAATGTGGFLASNYIVTYVPYSAYVTPATLAITATGPQKSYGTVLAPVTGTLNFTSVGMVNGDQVTGMALSPDAAGQSATTATGAAYVITPSAPTGNSTFIPANYSISYYPYYGTVTTATVVITATGPTKTFGQALTATTGGLNFIAAGMAAGEGVTGITLTPDAAGQSVTTAYNAGYQITPSAATGTGGFLASNYTMVYNPYNGLVAKAPLTVTATGPAKIYGQGLTAATSATSFTVSGLLGTDLVTGVTLTPNAAGQALNTQTNSAYSVAPSLATGNSSFAAANYLITYIPFTGTVNPATLTVAATGPAKQFGAALAVGPTGINFTATGAISGEAVSAVILTPDGPGQAANTPKGSTYVVTPSAATGTGGFNVANYLVNYQAYTGTVTGTVLTITATGPGRVYGTPLSAGTSTTNYTVSGLLGNDQITGVTLTPNANGSAAATASGSAYSVTPSGATGNGSFLASNYIINYVAYNGVVSPLALTIAATGPAKTYRSALTAGTSTANFTATGLAAGDVVSSVTLTPDAAGSSVTTAAGAAYVVSPTAATGNSSFSTTNYTITYLPYTGTVGASVLTVTATGPAKTYGLVLSAATSTTNFTATGTVGGEAVTGLTLTPNAAGASATTPSGTGYSVMPSAATGTGGFLASNYTVNYIPFTGVVTPQALAVNAVGPLKKYGVALTAGISTSSFVATGLLPGETVTSVTLTPDAAGLSASTATGATYTVAASAATGAGGFLASNYTITYGTYSGTVGNINLTITATSPNKTYGTALATATAGSGFIVSGTQQGETVTGLTLTPNAAGLSATSAAGTSYTVTPSGATGTGGFLASNYVVTYVPYTGSVIAAPLQLLATGPAKGYGTALSTTASVTNFTASGAVGSDIVTGVTLTPDAAGSSATTSVGATYLVTPSLPTGNAGFLASNYLIAYLPYTGTVSPVALTLTATGPNKPYGTALVTSTTSANFAATGMIPGETVTGVTLTPDAAGQGASTPSGAHYVMTPSLATGAGGFLASNYTINYVPYTGTVNALTLTITATGTSKTYGQALIAAAGTSNFTVTGAVGGDVVSGITLTPDAPGASATTAVGTHFVMTPSQPTGNSSFIASNYTITYIGFTGTVTGALLTVNATGPLKKYGIALAAGTSGANFTITGTIAGETVTTVMLTPDAAGLSAATASGAPYSVAASAAIGTGGFLASNYTIVYNTYNGIVGTTALTITATNPVKTYGTALTAGASTKSFITTGTFAGEAVTSVTLTPDMAGAAASTQTGSSFSVTPSAATGSGGFLASNYVVTYVPYSGIVIPAALTVTATGPSKAYGVPLSAGTSTTNFGVTGLVNGDGVSSVTLTPNSAGLSATTASGAGYIVIPSAPTGTASFLTSNYTITYVPYYGTVVVTPLIITATGPGKSYGTALTAGTSTANFTASGMLPGQSVTGLTLTPDANGLSSTTPAGSTYTVQPSLPTGTGGFQAANYTIVYVGFTGTVAKRTLNITATGVNKVYTNSPAATVTLTDDRVTGDILTASYNSASFSDKNVGTAKVVTASGISISGAGSVNYTVAGSAVTTAAITPAPAVLTAQAVTKVYNRTVSSIILPVITGLIGSDNTGLVLSQTYDTYNTGSGKTLTPAAVISDGNGGFNYSVTLIPSLLGAITTAPVAVTAVSATKVYDGTLVSSTVPVVSGLIAPDATGTFPVETFDTPSIGSGKTLTPAGLVISDGNGGNNYAITYVASSSGTVNSAVTTAAFLSSLTSSVGTLSPAFAATTTSYTVLVGYTTSSAVITPTVSGAISALTVNGLAVASGAGSAPITLNYGLNTVTVKVVSLDGSTTSTYTLTFNRGEHSDADLIALFPSAGILSPKFDSATVSYTAAVDYFVSSTIIATKVSDSNATVTINGNPAPKFVSQGIVLNVGGNLVTIEVTAQDGITRKTYTVLVTRAKAPVAVLGDNILTPNGDGVNDLWVISGILSYPKNVVTVYDRSGRIVFTQKTYDNTWGGYYRGALLPEDTYYYTIDLGDGSKQSRGFITLLHDHK